MAAQNARNEKLANDNSPVNTLLSVNESCVSIQLDTLAPTFQQCTGDYGFAAAGGQLHHYPRFRVGGQRVIHLPEQVLLVGAEFDHVPAL